MEAAWAGGLSTELDVKKPGFWVHPFTDNCVLSGIMSLGLRAQRTMQGGLNHPEGPFRSVVPVKEEPGDMKICEINSRSTCHCTPNPEKARLEQRDH